MQQQQPGPNDHHIEVDDAGVAHLVPGLGQVHGPPTEKGPIMGRTVTVTDDDLESEKAALLKKARELNLKAGHVTQREARLAEREKELAKREKALAAQAAS